MRRAARVDVNQKEIVTELRNLGYCVAITSQLGNGFPDIVVGYRGVNLMFEIKATVKDKLTEHEKAFHDDWKGSVFTITSASEVRRLFEDYCFNRI